MTLLPARWYPAARSERPVLVWLHGFLGSSGDWLPLPADLHAWSHLVIDLPGHGEAARLHTDGFETLSASLTATLRFYQAERYWLIGYSLGGRVAMYHACRYGGDSLAGLIVEAGHTGLADRAARQQRREHDARWAALFRGQPLEETLMQWYQQPVFADLTPQQRQQLIALRVKNDPDALAAMLQATSLGLQPCLLAELRQLTVPFHYLCGELDRRFRQLARQASLPCHVIPAAGHNAHYARKPVFSRLLADILNHSLRSCDDLSR